MPQQPDLYPVNIIVDEAPLKVKFVVVAKSNATFIDDVFVIVDVPSVRDLTLALFDEIPPVVILKFFVLNEPLTKLILPMVALSCNSQLPPTPSNVIPPILRPAVVIDLTPDVEFKTTPPLNVIPLINVKFPPIVKVPLLVKVGALVAPVQIISLQYPLVIFIVTVCPVDENELASKYTLSVADGIHP